MPVFSLKQKFHPVFVLTLLIKIPRMPILSIQYTEPILIDRDKHRGVSNKNSTLQMITNVVKSQD